MSSSDRRPSANSAARSRGDRLRRGLTNHWPALAVGAVFLALSLFYSVTVPAWEADNELSHFNYVRYLVQHRALPGIDALVETPVTTDACRSGEQVISNEITHQFRQPPLYYVLGALTTFWSKMDTTGPEAANAFRIWDARQLGYNFALHNPAAESFPYAGTLLALHSLRWMSGVLGLLGLLATYLLGLLLFDGRRLLAVAMMAVNAFIPQYIFASAIVNNDILVAVLGNWCVLLCAYAVLRDSRLRILFLPVLLAGLAIMTKYNGIVLLPLVAVTLAVVVARTVRERRERALPMVVALGAVTALASIPVLILLLNNRAVYGRFLAGYQLDSEKIVSALPGVLNAVTPDAREAVAYAFATFWGQFGWDNITLPGAIIALLAAVCVLALAGVVVFLLDKRQSRWLRFVVLAACLFLLTSIVLSYARAIGSLEPRGRYLLPAISAVSFLLVLGLQRLLPGRLKSVGVTALWIGLLLLAIAVPFTVIKPAYAAPPLAASAELLPGESPLDVTIGDFARLIGYRVEPQELAEGDPLRVTLVWQALRSTPNNYVMSIHLLDANRFPRAWVMSHPGRGNFPTSIWQPGDVFRDTYRLYWAETPWDRLPAASLLKVALFCPGSAAVDETYLEVTDAQGSDLGDAVYFGRLKVTGDQPPAQNQPEAVPLYTAGDEIALESYRVLPEKPIPGQQVTIEMRWRTLQQPAADYTVFAHLVDENGQQIGGNDLSLTDGYYPSSMWVPGEVITHTHRLDLPVSLPAGVYAIEVGVYEPQSGQRLALRDADTGHLPDDLVVLAEFPVFDLRIFLPMVEIRSGAGE
ncbi:MAG: glycosyltransferase family 39 protein [Caldilineales bacterium]